MKPETRSFYRLAVERALTHVVRGLDQALDLEELARTAALSPFHFHRIFRGMVGETPLELHRRLRLERAATVLALADTGITAIAFDAGYDSHEAFTRAFRSAYGCSPSEFRAQCRQAGNPGCERPPQIEIATPSGLHFSTLRDPGSPLLASPTTKEPVVNVEIKTMPALRTATLRHLGPYNRISEAFARLGEIVGRAGLLRTRPTMLAIYHDDPESTPEAELRSDAAVTIPDDAPVPEGLVERQVAGGQYATTVHIGPYEQLGDAWARLMGRWLPESGQRIDDGGVSYEIYRNTPMEVERDKLVTELYVPLA